MPITQMINEVLTGTLAPRHRDVGLSLIEQEDGLHLLNEEGKDIEIYPNGEFVEAIYKRADKYLTEGRNGK